MSQLFQSRVDSLAFFTDSMSLLQVSGSTAESFLSSAHAARFVTQYFPLQHGDCVAFNDPLGGSPCPFGVNLVGRHKSIIWSLRVTQSRPWKDHEKWDGVGSKIPLLPLKMQGVENQQIPPNFLHLLKPYLSQVSSCIAKLETYINWNEADFKKPHFDFYLESTRKSLQSILKEAPWQEHSSRSRSMTGETLSLNISFTEQIVMADLSGTTQSSQLELSDKTTDSILIYGLLKSLNCQDLYTGSTEKYFQVIKPTQCWLNSKDPKFPARGRWLAAPFLMSHLKQLLLRMKLPVEKWNCSVEGWTQFESTDGSLWTDSQHLRLSLGSNSKLFDVVGPTEEGLLLKTKVPLRFLHVKAGILHSGQLEVGQTWPLPLIYS